jgi:hypothetical protein
MSKLILAYGICLASLAVFMRIGSAVSKRRRNGPQKRRLRENAAAPLAPWMAAAVILSML